MLAVLGFWALVPTVYALVGVWRHGGVVSGGESFGVVDQFQYMAWIRESGEHVLASNRFDVDGDRAVYLQPMWLLSGLGWRAGLPVQAAFLLWKPVAVAVLFWGYAAYARRFVAGAGRRALALALAFFYLAPLNALVHALGALTADTREWAGLFTYELAPAMFTWGYFPAALAAGATPLFLLAVERVLDPARRRPGRSVRAYALGAAAAGLAASWVHPWQGIVLAVLLVLAAGWSARAGLGPSALRSLALPALGLAAPLVYYVALGHWDSDWNAAAGDTDEPHHWRSVVVVVAPLALAAAGGWWAARRRVVLDLGEMLLRAWPVAILVVYTELRHENVLQGLALPLALLAVRLWPEAAPRAALATGIAVAAVAALPGAAYELDKLNDSVANEEIASRLRPGEAAALRHIGDSPRDGTVLTRFYLGEAVPSQAGRRSYIGHPIWTRDLGRRESLARELLSGRLSPARARELVRSTDAAFVLSDCRLRADLRPSLGPLVERELRFGCATVYEVRR